MAKVNSDKRTPAVSGIYAITCKVTKQAYVGSSVNIPGRWRIHLTELNIGVCVNPRLQELWKKYGAAAFTFEILEVVADRTMLDQAEAVWIKALSAEGMCLNRLHSRGEARTGIALRHSTKNALENLGKGSMDDTLRYLLSLVPPSREMK